MYVVPAEEPGPICGRPPACKSLAAADRIACDHMSGLMMAVHMTACQDGFRDAGSEHTRDVKHRRVPRSVSRLGSIDHTICSVSSKLRPQREALFALAQNSLCLAHRGLWWSRGAKPQRGALRGALITRSAALLAVHDRRFAAPKVTGSVVVFATDHQLPGNASGFVGERHRGELGRLTLKKIDQPRRGMSSSLLDLLDDSGGTDDQSAAQGLVAGTRDHAEPRLAGGGVIFWGEPEPGREVAARAESMRISDLHGEQRSPDPADGPDFRQSPAPFVALVPGHQLGFGPCHLDLQPGQLL